MNTRRPFIHLIRVNNQQYSQLASATNSHRRHSSPALPTRLADTGNQSLLGIFAKTDSANAKFAIHPAGTAAHFAAPFQSRRELRRFVRFCNFCLSCHYLVPIFSNPKDTDRPPNALTLGSVTLLRHLAPSPYAPSRYAASLFLESLNGIPNIRSNSRPSSSSSVEVTKTMFIPCERVNLSGFNSGKTWYSAKPRL